MIRHHAASLNATYAFMWEGQLKERKRLKGTVFVAECVSILAHAAISNNHIKVISHS